MRSRDHDYGPVIDPVNTDWSQWKIPGYSQEAVNLRIRKRVARSRMLRFRTVPVCRRVWFVTLTATQAIESEFKPRELAAGLTWTPQQFWCLSRRRARVIVDRDRAAGGSGSLFPVEYRLCPVCGRLLLGAEANSYRMKQMTPARRWHFPDGPACNMDCKPRGRGPGGQRMTYRKDRAA